MNGAAHDVIVVGAGPGGAAAAYALARRGVRTLLLDKTEFPREKVCGDGLTPRAVAALGEMDLLDRLRPVAQPIAGVDITAPDGATVTAAVRTSTGPHPAMPAMLVVRRFHLDDAIRRRAVEAGATFQGGVDVQDVVREGEAVAVRGAREGRPATYRARLAIVATGASIALPRRLGALARPPAMMHAARTYVSLRRGREADGKRAGGPRAGVSGAGARIEIRFAGVPLPGYGWIFPTSPSAANAGVGFFTRRGRPRPARAVCERFLATVDGTGAIAGDAPPIRSYPLRVDFPASPVYADGVLFAGEAAGLVNPLTGEGIDYALDSGRIAAEHAAAFLGSADRSPRGFAAAASSYERALRGRFERLFAACRMLRDVSGRAIVLNRLVRVAARRDDLTEALVDIVLGNREPLAASSVRWAIGRALFVR